MSTKKVLIIAHLFPPYGGVGVMRALGFVKYLRDFDWEPIVLAAHTEKVGPKDPGLLNELPKDIKIYRQQYIESIWLRRFFKMLRLDNLGTWLENFLFIPDPQILWLPRAYIKALKIIKEENIDLIFSTSAPYSSHLLAKKLKAKTGLPWVADFRDPWSKNPYAKWITPLHKKTNCYLEQTVLKTANIITATSPYTTTELKSLWKSNNLKKFKLITNGFDASSIYHSKQGHKTSKFTIKYLGSIFASRPPVFLFQSISELLAEKKIQEEKLLLEFIGNIHLSKAPSFLKVRRSIPHNDFIKEANKADLLLLISEQPGIIPAKFFEYLITGKYIFGLVHRKSDIIDLIKETNSGQAIIWDDVQKIKETILEKYTEWQKTGKVKNNLTWERIKKYSRKELTAQLANYFNEAIA